MANFTEKAILETFDEMLKEMPFDKLTVSALVSRCGISSNTFYYHFRDIYDLLDVWFEQKKKIYLSEAELEKDWEKVFKNVLYVMKDNMVMVHHVFDSLSRERIEKHIFDSSEKWFYAQLEKKADKSGIDKSLLKDISSCFCYSIIGFLLKFIWNSDEVDIEKEMSLLGKIYQGYYDYLIKNVNDIA